MINIIANVKSGKGRGLKNLTKVTRFLINKGEEFSVYITNAKGHATELAGKLSRNGGTIVALGGDGTFHEVLNGIADMQNTVLGFIPSGRGNDFVRAAGCSLNPIKAISDIVRGEIRKVDYIQIGEKRCLNVAGTGLDIAVLEAVAGATNKLTYVASLLKCIRHFDPYHVTVKVNGAEYTYDCIMAGVCNGIAFGGNIRLSPLSKIDDGKLDVIVMDMPPNTNLLKIVPRFKAGKHMDMAITKHFVCDEVHIDTAAPIELDGEIYRELKFDCKVVKGGLKTFICNR